MIKTTGGQYLPAGQYVYESKGKTTSSSLPAGEYIRKLSSLFPGRDIVIADIDGKEGLKDYALSHEGGMQIVISGKALEKMMADPEFERQCTEALKQAQKEQADKLMRLPEQGKSLVGSGIYLEEDGDVSRWVLSRKQPEQKLPSFGEKQGAGNGGSFSTGIHTEKGTLTIEKKKASYVPAKDLVKIARSRNRQDVRRTISGIQAQIYQLKTGSGDKRVKAVLVKQAEQVLSKARVKDKQLKKEEFLKWQQKRAAQKAELEKSLQLKLLLKRKQAGRKAREYGQIRDYYETPQERRLEKELEKYENTVSVENSGPTGNYYAPSPGGPEAVPTGSMTGGTVGMTLDITV